MKNVKLKISKLSYRSLYLFMGLILVLAFFVLFYGGKSTDNQYIPSVDKIKESSLVGNNTSNDNADTTSQENNGSSEATNNSKNVISSDDKLVQVDNKNSTSKDDNVPAFEIPASVKDEVEKGAATNNSANNDDENNEVISDGTVLKLKHAPKEFKNYKTDSYVVKKGDRVASVIVKYGYSKGDLYALRPGHEKLIDTLNIGDTIYMKKDSKGKLMLFYIKRKDNSVPGYFVYNKDSKKYEFYKD